MNKFILNVLILILIITSNIEHFASNVTFFIKQFGFCFPSHLLLHCQPCLLSTPRICMHSVVSMEYLKHFQNTKYLNRPDKQVTGGIVLGGISHSVLSAPAIFSYRIGMHEPHDPSIKRVPEPSLLNCSRHILPGLELGKPCVSQNRFSTILHEVALNKSALS